MHDNIPDSDPLSPAPLSPAASASGAQVVKVVKGDATHDAPDDAAAVQALIDALRARASVHDVPHEGRMVRWYRFGSGAPVALLHGGHGSWLHWARNIDALAASFTVWVADMPGYGDSELPEPRGMDGLVAAVAGTLDTLVGAGQPVDLVGFSFGGLVAARVAALRGAIPRLALLGPAGHGGLRRPRGELTNWRFAAQRRDERALAAAMRHNLMVHMLNAEASLDALALAVHTQSCERTRFRSKDISRAGGLRDCVLHCNGQVLLIWGEHDVTVVPTQAAAEMTRTIDRLRARIVPDAGHWVQYEQAEVTNRLLLDFLTT